MKPSEALSSAQAMVNGIPREFLDQMGPLVDGYMPIVFHALVRFGRWNEILNSDSVHYGGTGKGNLGQVKASGGNATVTLPPLATIMLEYAG